ncbi:hypothetical protein M2227_004562 [Bradyrhizobium elkanii]|uniref:hypothetical protein n=1 Tax=Bradyrhizobium elkanii TaxID=29448 RepID=UPI0003A9ABA2|nr:hypothetical protein [Bradyrhizobium elkanii]UQD78838.1 hypothetical protein JEY66_28435 [Bradyrhizobium elkanii USDA 76]MCS3593038.1 hypothetical protein [Bradyrhizobium elkanii]MCS3622483.1 hypothetical protein [Bradyrhizobium elkanii]MCW2109050.1 hypothetical protein [Bradyrhizobium elkanii]MCW2202472.1 hypothetical protein [Bradyrhizobium elkanii]
MLLPQRTLMLGMGYLESAFAVAVVDQLEVFVTSGGGEYWINCPKPRKAFHADMNWKPAIAMSASGRSRAMIRKRKTIGISNATAPR